MTMQKQGGNRLFSKDENHQEGYPIRKCHL